MATKERLVEKAVSYVGQGYKHFCDSFWGGCFAWCAAFVSVVCKESGVDAPWSTSCTQQRSEWQKRGQWHTDRNIQIGDIVYYDWDLSGDCDHVGICTAIEDGTLRITEGNFGNLPNSQTKVTHRFIKPTYKYICGYARPTFDKSTESTTKPSNTTSNSTDKIIQVETKQVRFGSTGVTVRVLQAALEELGYSVGKYGVDGEIGRDTENAIKAFQKDKGLTVDGIAGKNTWNALLK